MIFSKKSCVTCAFCLYCRDTFYGYPNPKWNYQKNNLTDYEISLLMNGDTSFLSEAKRKREEWIATYEKRKEERRKKVEETNKEFENTILGKALGKDFFNKISSFSEISSSVLESNPYPLREEFGMEPCPIVPNYEYLKCWKEVWGEKDENVWTALKNKKCRNYYPLSKKETKSLEACDEERKERVDDKKYWRGVVVGFFSAFVIMILRFLLMPYFTSMDSSATNDTIPMQQKVIRIQPSGTTQNDNTSDLIIEEKVKQNIIENAESEE